MTRKQALLQVIVYLTELKYDNDVIEKLKEIAEELPFTKWSRTTIFDAIEQFYIENKRYPNTKEFDKFGLPPHAVIKHKFNMTTKEFMDCYYPKRYTPKNKRYSSSSNEILNDFKEQFLLINPNSSGEYNKKRRKGSPTWNYTAKLYNLRKWNELLEICKLNQDKKTNPILTCEIISKNNLNNSENIKNLNNNIKRILDNSIE